MRIRARARCSSYSSTIAALALALATGCGEDSEEAAPEAAGSRCVRVPAFILRGIEEGLTVSGGGSLRNGYAVRSDDFVRAYFVAADIQGSGLDGSGDVGLWVTNRLDEAVGFLSVNGAAREFSDWGDGGATDAEFSMFDDGADEALDCAGG